MNDSIQNLHKRRKKEVNVEIGRENLIKCRYAEIPAENRHAGTIRPHHDRKDQLPRAAYAAQLLDRFFAVYENFCGILQHTKKSV